MPITCRPTRLDDLELTDALVVSAINHLTERHGFGRMASRSAPTFQAFSLQDDARGLWTAEEDGEVVGFAWSWVCEDFWFLAQLFVKPDLQSRGVGRELLQRALGHADLIGAKQRALITFAFNTVSQGLYIAHGLLPRFPIYSMKVARRLMTPHGGDAILHSRLLDADRQVAALGEIDRKAIGVSREKHHRLLLGEPGVRALGLHEGGRLVGYAYISANGHIGPLAVASPDLTERAFTAALAFAAQGETDSVTCFIPGSNAGILRTALANGFRIVFPMLMMSREDLGDWRCYLPRNPGFM